MTSTLITYLQVFGIGFSFGIAGPCFLACTPAIVIYIAGSKRGPAKVFKDVFTFLSGRLLAYVLLGALAGLSGTLLKNIVGSPPASYLRPLAGVVTILFAIIILTGTLPKNCHCGRSERSRRPIFNFGGVFAFGFLMGISPCAPLLALLFDITLMSKGALDGMLYALFFGLGTFVSGFITIGAISGILTRAGAVFVKSETAIIIFKVMCALLLLALGLGLILKG